MIEYVISCPSFDKILGYADGTLEAEEEKDINAHVKKCDSCRQEFLTYQQLKRTLEIAPFQQPDEPCLTEDIIGRFLSDTLEEVDRERVFGHLSKCPVCRTEVIDIGVASSQVNFERALQERSLQQICGADLTDIEGEGAVLVQDTKWMVTVHNDGTVRLGQATLPPFLSQSVFDFVTKGEVELPPPVRVAMETRYIGATRSEQDREETAPIPLSPVRTAVRTTTPILQWTAVPGAQEYKVTIAFAEEKEGEEIVWQQSVKETQVTLPSGILNQGEAYLWQVGALVEEQLQVSPIVGFWVLNMEALHDVEAVERNYPTSALVLASMYEAHGLYEEALTQVERLVEINPNNPSVHAMLHNLRRQLGREEK